MTICIIIWAGRYCLVKGGRHILYDQGGIRQIIGPAGRDTTNYRPCRVGYGKLSALQGGIRQIISPAGLYIILKPWASSGKYQNQKGVCLLVPSAIAKLIGYLPFHVIMLICHPCPRERENMPPTGHIMPPMGLIICPRATSCCPRVALCCPRASGPLAA